MPTIRVKKSTPDTRKIKMAGSISVVKAKPYSGKITVAGAKTQPKIKMAEAKTHPLIRAVNEPVTPARKETPAEKRVFDRKMKTVDWSKWR